MSKRARKVAPKTEVIFNQPSWKLKTRECEVFITRLGGHLAPATFTLGPKKISPFEVAPWAHEKIAPDTTPVLKPLRGDFFCLPFGGNARPVAGKQFPVHGETACEEWSFHSFVETDQNTILTLNRSLKIGGGNVVKHLELRHGETNIYQRHIISGISGPLPVGHHPILKFPDAAESAYISTSKFIFGQVFPEPVERPEQLGYSSLKPGSLFTSLGKVQTVFGNTTDVSRYPARRGFEDIVLLASDPTLPFAWTAAAFPSLGYVWFALKDPRVLTSTLLWISNGGRHYAPWSSRHINAMGLEEITGYFHTGAAESIRKNPLNTRGIPTSLKFSRNRPTSINYIMGVAPISSRFKHVKSITPSKDGINITSEDGAKTFVKLDLSFLQSTINSI